MKLPVDSVRRLLVIRPDHIGDLMLITPVLRSIKLACPGIEITALIKAYTDPIARRIDDIDHIMHDQLARGQYTRRQFFDVLGDIRGRRFDMVIHFTTDYPYTFLTWLARIPFRVGDYARLGMRPWLNVPVHQHYRNTTLHEIQHNYDLCNVFSTPLSEQPMVLRVTADEIAAFKQKHELLPLTVGARRAVPLQVIHLGTGGGNKPWLPEGFAQVADQIFERHGIRSIVIGSASEKNLAERFFAAARAPHINLVGATELADLPVAIACADYFMGVDSGPLHLASALGKPIVAIFPTKMVKAAHWGPWHVPQVIVHPATRCELKCVPRDCALSTCLDDLAPAVVLAAFDRLLKGEFPKTPLQQHWHRVRQTLGLALLAHTPSGLAKQQALAECLRREGFQVNVFNATLRPLQVQKLASALNQHNLHLFIVESHTKLWQLTALLSGRDVFIPPLVLGLCDVPETSSNYAEYFCKAFGVWGKP